jgi:tetratricopeptide (TPR) repeat protein
MKKKNILVPAVLALVPAAYAHDDHKLGTLQFPVSCNAEASRHFTTGMLLQYNYHWAPARKAFENAAAADPACGMAHYGTAVTLMDNILAGAPSPKQLVDGRTALAKARSAGLPTPREKDYVTAADAFFAADEKQPPFERMDVFAGAMKRVSEAHPRDSEASVIYAWALLASAQLTDKTYSKQLQAAGILEKIARDQPDHPGVVHFLVHAYDYPAIASKGVPPARKYAKLAAAAPHALHMPSHIFTRMGYWQDSVDTNIASAKACGDVDWCKMHAYDYMVYAYLQMGKVDEAAKVVAPMREYVAKVSNEGRFVAAYALASAPLRLALETGQWKTAADFTLPATTQEAWSKVGSPEMIYSFGRGLGAARAGNVAAAKAEIERLNGLEKRMTERGDKYWAGQSAIHAKTLEAWVAKAEGQGDDAIRLMRQAADMEDATEKHIVTPGPLAPAREMLGEMLLDIGEHRAAYGEFVKTLEREPGRRRTLMGASMAAEKAGDAGNAQKYKKMIGPSAEASGLVPVAAKAEDEPDPCPCRYCRET